MPFSPDRLASPAYGQLLREVHATQRWGSGGKHHVRVVATFARELGARTILDYGCGRGTLKPSLAAEFDVREYDPGILGKDGLPASADLVVCTDVLEHIEPELLDDVLRHLRSLTRLGAFFVISCKPAKLTLPDGRNAHLIQQSPEWWTRKLVGHGFVLVSVGTSKGLWTWCRV